MNFQELEINQESLAKLDAYSVSCSPCQFLQSNAWLKFQESIGHKAHIFSFEHENKTIYFSVFEHHLPLAKKYYYIPRGPVLGSANLWPVLLNNLNNLFKKNKTLVFARLEPDATFVNHNLKRVIDVQPCNTFYTDLKNSEEEILNLMHSKTRYNIRLGLKKDLKFQANDSDIESFWKLMEETTQRDKFSSHHKSYYEKMISSGAVQLATIRHNNEVIAAGIFSKFGNTMTYLHGASSSANRELMAPYVLHWLMIQQAKAEGLTYYDWHGIDEKKWPGVTRFKLGFKGHNVDYPGTFDLILAPTIYLGYNILRGIRRLF
ncbi:MAG: peptidoglycan bridge formation glycyltransferase FemA/FemB family protein [Candidatus Falkowbacteria bacterium]|nr:peptidoglycan bridge formation glycyltransferase FemA/FemB family protein [Candidatus Falkowbacteria bacterium]